MAWLHAIASYVSCPNGLAALHVARGAGSQTRGVRVADFQARVTLPRTVATFAGVVRCLPEILRRIRRAEAVTQTSIPQRTTWAIFDVGIAGKTIGILNEVDAIASRCGRCLRQSNQRRSNG